MPPEVSVFLAVYNHEEYVGAAIESEFVKVVETNGS